MVGSAPNGLFSFAMPSASAHAGGMEGTFLVSRRLFWRLQIAGWLLVIPFFSGVAMVVFGDLKTSLAVGVARQIIGFGLTLGMWRIYRRWPAATFRFATHVWKIFACCVLATAADVALSEPARILLNIAEPPPLAFHGVIFVRLALYVAWSALYFAIRQELETRDTALRLARAEAANREAELQFLRAQVNPHFLFNALNTIIAQAETNPAKVADTTHAVADYLRYSLSHVAHRAPLGDELTAMDNYLHVESAGFGPDRLDWRIEASDEARNALAPTALVQPLIENALKYGLRTSPPPLRLRVNARTEAGALVVTVENSGTWITRAPGEKARDSTGIGLGNLRRRLELLCGPEARLETGTAVGGVLVEVRLPFTGPAAG